MNAVSIGLSVLLVVALVNLLKGIGLSGKWSAAAAVAIGVFLAVGDVLLATNAIYVGVINGVKVGLGAAGLYDVTKK